MQIVSSTAKSGFLAGFAGTGGKEHLRKRPVSVIHLLLICLPFLDFSFSQYICHISFPVVNHLYSIIFVRSANDNHWQSHFLFVHYSPRYPVNTWRTGLQKSYTGTLQSRASHHLHSLRIIANQAFIIRVRWFLKWVITRNIH